MSIRIAKQLRELVQGAYREEEWRDIDEAFYHRILTGFQEYHAGTRRNAVAQLQLTHHN